MKVFKIVLAFSLGLNIVLLFFIFGKKLWDKNFLNFKSDLRKSKEEEKQMIHWKRRNELFEALPASKKSIVFIGNSLTQNFEFAEFFQDSNIKNRGISGDKIIGVTNRILALKKLSPQKIFLEIGINDLTYGDSKESIVHNYKKLLDKIQDEFINTEIYVQSLFPIENKIQNTNIIDGAKINIDIKFINEKIQKYAGDKGFFFIDTHIVFQLNGQLNPIYSADGIHLSALGYMTWCNVLKPYLG